MGNGNNSIDNSNNTNNNMTDMELKLVPTDLRVNPAYSAYRNWSRLIVLGIAPFLMLSFFNFRIFQVSQFFPTFFSKTSPYTI